MLTWAALPTVTLVAGSLVRPLFLDRYVTASDPGLAIAIALPAAWAISGSDVRFADRSRVVVEGVLMGIAAVILSFVFSVPAARLTYVEAISQVTPRAYRVAGIVAREDRHVEMAEQATLVHPHDG